VNLELPLKPNGKVDRRRLSALSRASRNVRTAFVAPSTAMERRLAQPWGSVLQIEPIGVDDNFFDLGGHSLSVAEVLGTLKRSYDIDMPGGSSTRGRPSPSSPRSSASERTGRIRVRLPGARRAAGPLGSGSAHGRRPRGTCDLARDAPPCPRRLANHGHRPGLLVADEVPRLRPRPARPHGLHLRAWRPAAHARHGRPELVDGLLPYLDRPHGLFGHCGAALARYETTVYIAQRGYPLPTKLFVSFQVVPHHGPRDRLLGMTDAELRAELGQLMIRLGGEPVPSLIDLALGILREGIEANKRYSLPDPPRLPVTITAIGWSGDFEVPYRSMGGWADCGVTDFDVLEGEHYTFTEAPAALLRVFSAGLLPTAAGRPR
jgi:surfactin synthase thioesterase subunit